MVCLIKVLATAYKMSGKDLSLFVVASAVVDAFSYQVRWCTNCKLHPSNFRVWRVPTGETVRGILPWYDHDGGVRG